MSATVGADAHAAAVTAEADLAVLHTNAAHADQEAQESERRQYSLTTKNVLTYRYRKCIMFIKLYGNT